MITCPVCGGHGADPASDNVNWLPCSSCRGTGEREQPAVAGVSDEQKRDGSVIAAATTAITLLRAQGVPIPRDPENALAFQTGFCSGAIWALQKADELASR